MQEVVADWLCTQLKPPMDEPCLLPCPYDCVVSGWSSWSPCSLPCTTKNKMPMRHRNRTVIAPHGTGKHRCLHIFIVWYLNIATYIAVIKTTMVTALVCFITALYVFPIPCLLAKNILLRQLCYISYFIRPNFNMCSVSLLFLNWIHKDNWFDNGSSGIVIK